MPGFLKWIIEKILCIIFLNTMQVADGFTIKYTASVIGLLVYAAPLYYSKEVSLTAVIL